MKSQKKNWDNLDIYEKNYELLRLNALIGDLHTVASPTIKSNETYPFRVGKFREGYFIRNCTTKSFADDNMFAQVLAVNNLDIDELKRIAKGIICTEAGAFESKFCDFLTDPLLLKIANVTEIDGTIVTVKKNGNIYSIKVKATKVDSKTKRLNWIYNKTKPNFCLKTTDKYCYIDINKFVDDKKMNMNKLYFDIMKAIDCQKPFIIDVRGNGGGNFKLFKKSLEQIAKEGAKGYCLIDEKTCSAAVMTAKALKNAGFILVGSPTKQPSTFYGGVYNNLETRSGFQYRVATRLVDDNQISHYKNIPSSTRFPDVPLQPDVLIEPSIEDFKKGKDPALNYCKENVARFIENDLYFDYP